MQFIHGINLGNWYACWNLQLSGRLMSPDMLALVDAGIRETHISIKDTPLDELLINGSAGSCVLAPRHINEVVKGAILRRGQHLANGFNEVELMSPETRNDIVTSADVELEFERIRREVSPNSPSRLSCIYMADRSKEGEALIKRMLGNHIYILNVRIESTLSICRADSAWFDGYFENRDIQEIRNYWLGCEKPGHGLWEYLLDGSIVVENNEQINHIKEFGRLMP